MRIRRYEPADTDALLDLFYQTVHSVCRGDYTPVQLDAWADGAPDREAWARSLARNYALVAEEDGEIVGFGDIDDSGYLDRLYVHRAHQRRGIATALCDRLEAHAAGRAVTVHASITARPFFEARGYRVLRAQRVERHGVALCNFVMEKPPRGGEGRTQMRRKDREVTDIAQICEVIDRCKVIRLALNVPGAPYIVPMNFGWALEDGAPVFYLHCAAQGRKLELLRADERAGFEMDGAHALKEGGAAFSYSFGYESVIGEGRVEFVTDASQKARALERILLHQCGRALPVREEDAAPVTVLRLRAEALSCKRNA